MAQATYTTPVVTLATRAKVYQGLAWLLEHCDAYNINLLSIVRNADNSVTITASGPVTLAADLAIFGVS